MSMGGYTLKPGSTVYLMDPRKESPGSTRLTQHASCAWGNAQPGFNLMRQNDNLWLKCIPRLLHRCDHGCAVRLRQKWCIMHEHTPMLSLASSWCVMNDVIWHKFAPLPAQMWSWPRCEAQMAACSYPVMPVAGYLRLRCCWMHFGQGRSECCLLLGKALEQDPPFAVGRHGVWSATIVVKMSGLSCRLAQSFGTCVTLNTINCKGLFNI